MEYIIIRVSNQSRRGLKPTLEIKGMLRVEGYHWHSKLQTWDIVRLAEGFSVKKFANQPMWSDLADGIEVGFYDHLDNMVELYHVDGGQWRRVSDNGRESDD